METPLVSPFERTVVRVDVAEGDRVAGAPCSWNWRPDRSSRKVR